MYRISAEEGILSVLNNSSYQTLLAVTQNDPKKEMEYLSAFDDKQVDGIILVATVFSSAYKRILKKLSVPVVIVGQQLSGYCCVFHDDYHASYDLTRLLLEKGRNRLGYIGAIQQDKAVGAERYRGFKDAVSSSGYAELADNHVIALFSVASGYEKTGELLEKCPDLNGLICATDSMAAGAVQYLQEHNIRIPEQILVAGQGDSDMSKVTSPPLITVHYSYEKSGELAIHMLMELLEQKETAVKEVKLGYYLVDPDPAN